MYQILQYGSSWLITFWVWDALILRLIKTFKPDATGIIIKAMWTVYHELKPFYLPAVAVNAVTDIILRPHVFIVWRALGIGVNVWMWFMYKDLGDDDDRWKRRQKKATEAIKRVGSRLVVAAPEPAPARA